MDIGEKLPNSTYTGILGWLQSKKVDLYLRGEPDYLHEDWLTKSVPIRMSSVITGQNLHERTRDNVSFFNLLSNFNVGITLTAVYLVSFLAILGFAFLISQLSPRIEGRRRTLKLSKRISLILMNFQIKRLSAISFFFVSVHLFLWFTRLFLINNIKTNKVVVDTSHLIKDERDILSTRKVACMLKKEPLTNMVASSPRNSLLTRIYEKTRLRPEMTTERQLLGGDRCLLFGHSKMSAFINSDSVYFLGERNTGNLVLTASFMLEGAIQKVWGNQKSIWEYALVIYYNGDYPDIAKTLIAHAESGILSNAFDCLRKTARASCRAAKITLFQNLDDFIKEFSGFSDLVLDNFRYIFLHYALACSLVLVTFGAHHLTRLTKRSVGVILLKDYLLRFATRLRQLIRRLLIRPIC